MISCTLEPARSIGLTPRAVNSAAISAHLMSAGVGVARIRSSVRRCRLRIFLKWVSSLSSVNFRRFYSSPVFPVVLMCLGPLSCLERGIKVPIHTATLSENPPFRQYGRPDSTGPQPAFEQEMLP